MPNNTGHSAPRNNSFSPLHKWLTLIVVGGLSFGSAFLSTPTGTTPYTDAFFPFILSMLVIAVGCNYLTKAVGDDSQQALLERENSLNQLTRRFNYRIETLENNYLDATFAYGQEKQLKRQYSTKYTQLHREYQKERSKYLRAWSQYSAKFHTMRSFWGWVLVIGLLSSIFSFTHSGPSIPTPQSSNFASFTESTQPTYWNASNIPMVHLQDATQYVSNPDHVLTTETVDRINKTMKQLDEELNIESAVIIVNHIEGDDPFRMAQDVGNNYGVGKDNRGLVVVVGYLDHSVNISPGTSLEADLTDAECRQLQQKYVIPCMRLELPDSAMIYLSEALYATLKGKQEPQLSPLLDGSLEDNKAGALGLYISYFLIWLIFLVYKNQKYRWFGQSSGEQALKANPFYTPDDTDDFFFTGGGGFFGGGSNGGFGGNMGSYGGGSFGGGGATSRW